MKELLNEWRKYLAEQKDTKAPKEEYKALPCILGSKCYIKAKRAAVRLPRKGEDVDRGKIIGYLKMGTKIKVIGAKGGFWKIDLGVAGEGWVAKARTTAKLKSRDQQLQDLGKGAKGSGRSDISFTTGARG